jgi:dCTP diphosphatase
MNSIEQLQGRIRALKRERNWEQFHTPKNISISISIEASELLEVFRWKEYTELSEIEKQTLHEEIGDVFINLLNLCLLTNIDLVQAANDKIEEISRKYPKEKFDGSAEKYNRS